MNLDLNLEPFVHHHQDDQPHNMTFEDLLTRSTSESGSNHPPVDHQLPPVWRHIPVPTNAGYPPPVAAAGGASASLADNNNNNNKRPLEPVKPDLTGDEASFFDCNICLDSASEPVVTCCGHLFCWPCIYRWLFVHSNAKQCPICKGEVTMKTVTPIYSRSDRTCVTKVRDPKIPSRPLANRIESWRHSFQRDALNLPIIEMVRRLDNNRFHLSREPLSSNPHEIPSAHLLNRIFTSRGIRTGRDSVPAASPDVTADVPNDHMPSFTSAESFVDSYFRDHPDEMSQDELPLIDRHSMSSVAGIIQSEGSTASTGRREPAAYRSRRRRLL